MFPNRRSAPMALIRVDATSVNQIRSGQVPIGPDLPTLLGADVAGTIEEVGAGVLDFAPGDEVYGCAGAPHGLPITHQQLVNRHFHSILRPP
jgi:NADPH2:quinone reductase